MLTMVTQSYVWSLMTGGHQKAGQCYKVVRDFMTFAVYIRRFFQGHPAVDRWITVLSDAILDCSCYMLPVCTDSRLAFTGDADPVPSSRLAFRLGDGPLSIDLGHQFWYGPAPPPSLYIIPPTGPAASTRDHRLRTWIGVIEQRGQLVFVQHR